MNKKSSLAKLRQLGPEANERLVKEVAESAARNEINYWGCSQAVIAALQDSLKLGNPDVFRAATAFAGGIASNREACGALIGGVMAIGLASGREHYVPGKVGTEQPELVECSARARLFCDRFRQEFGSLRCGEIRAGMGFNQDAKVTAMTPETFRAHDKCGEVAGAAARLAAGVILEPPERFAKDVAASLEMMARLRQELAAGK